MTELRPLTCADLAVLLDLEARCFDPPWSEALLRRRLEQPDSLSLGMFDGRELAGFVLCSRLFDEAELLQIAVAPARRREGLGRWLLETALSQLAEAGAERLLLEVRASNRAAIGLYRILGFQQDGRRRGYYPTDAGAEDAVLMSRELGKSPA